MLLIIRATIIMRQVPCKQVSSIVMYQWSIPSHIIADLARVEAIIEQRIVAQDAVARVASSHIATTNGLRLRAALTLLVAQLGSSVDNRVWHAAAAVELIQIAISVHSGLIDVAAMRRNEVVDHNRWRGDVSLMIGDYMFALAASEMALAPDPRIIEYFSGVVMAASEAELAPVMRVSPFAVAVEQYFTAASGATAALFEAACKAGMACGGGTDAEIETLGRFGYELGLAHHIHTDIVALTEHNNVANRITLPLLYAVEAGVDSDILERLNQPFISDSELHDIQQQIIRAGGLERARDEAERRINAALDILDATPESEAQQVLRSFAAGLIID